jgi:gas vesicle protein
MEAVKRIFKFGVGSAFGAAVGGGIAAFLAPQRGSELQAASRSLIQEAKIEGEEAQRLTEAEMARRFRIQVADDKALTGEVEHREPKPIS